MRISLRELMTVVAVAAVGLAGLKYASSAMLVVVQAMCFVLLLMFLVRAAVDRGREQAFAIGFAFCGVVYLITSVVATAAPNLAVGTFGTNMAISRLYSVFVTRSWFNKATGEMAANFQPTGPYANEAGEEARIELSDLSPPESVQQEDNKSAGDAGRALPDTGVATDNGAQRGGVRGFGGTGGGRGGGAGFRRSGSGGRGGGRGAMLVQLTPQQLDEYQAADRIRQIEIDNIFQLPQGQTAILSGRPLSTIHWVTYVRRPRPMYDDFERVGRCLWMLMIGYAGGLFARLIYARRTRSELA
ncbi:MAG: hypothetical protein WD669_06070 [Pirellulales bacterium]